MYYYPRMYTWHSHKGRSVSPPVHNQYYIPYLVCTLFRWSRVQSFYCLLNNVPMTYLCCRVKSLINSDQSKLLYNLLKYIDHSNPLFHNHQRRLSRNSNAHCDLSTIFHRQNNWRYYYFLRVPQNVLQLASQPKLSTILWQFVLVMYSGGKPPDLSVHQSAMQINAVTQPVPLVTIKSFHNDPQYILSSDFPSQQSPLTLSPSPQT